MRTAQYVRQERAIAAADVNGIRARWFYGLRLLRDPEAMGNSGRLRHGVTEQLVAAARQANLKLSASEIRSRIQCARTYPTEAQLARILASFEAWNPLRDAGFPPVERPDGEPDADHQTEDEKHHARARQLLDLVGPQGALFPLDKFEPAEATLKELIEFADRQDEITERFAAHGQKRRRYLARLLVAAGGDESMIWAVAAARIGEETAL